MKNNKILFFLIAVIIFTLNFTNHFVSTLPLGEYFDEEFSSEKIALSRLIYNSENGLSDHGGLLGYYNDVDSLYLSTDKEDYYAFKEKLKEKEGKISIYPSHAGLQDNILHPIWGGLSKLKEAIIQNGEPDDRWVIRLQKYDYFYFKMVTQAVVALLNAIVLTLFLLWVAREYSLKHAWITFGLILLTLPILGFFGRSMWWMMWSWFLPFVISLWSLSYSKKTIPPSLLKTIVIGGLLMIAIAIKAMMGYEYLSTILVAALIPFAYYAVKHNWGRGAWLSRSFIVSVLCLCGVVFALFSHAQALKNAGVDDPISLITNRLEMRAHGGENFNNSKPTIVESVDSSALALIGDYLVDPKGYGFPQLLFMAPFLWWLWRTRKRIADLSGDTKALLASVGLGFLGAISMLVTLKGHAYIHGFDIVIWTIPLNLLLCLFYARWFLEGSDLKK